MERFEWHTEEEGPVAPASTAASASRHNGLTAALVMAGLLMAATLIVWQMGRRAVAQEESVREDVKAAFGIWRAAVDRRDQDLLGTLLMGAEADWTTTQKDLLVSGKTLERRAIGLALIEDERFATDEVLEIDISNNWRAAEISFPTRYRSLVGEGEATDIRLAQTVSLVQEGSRWLLRRPGEEFWGGWHRLAGKIAVVSFRARDAEFAERILNDLDQDLGTKCASASEQDACPMDSKVHVRLESDAEILVKQTDQDRPTFAGRTFVVPTPTLLGRPLDDESYALLYARLSRPILETFEATLASPIDLPDQEVNLICFGRSGNLPRLFSYDPANDAWSLTLDAGTYRFLAAREDDTGVAMRQHVPGEPNRLRVVLWAAGQAETLHDVTYGPLTDHGIGWVDLGGGGGLLLAQYQGTTRVPSYYLIAVDESDSIQCLERGCLPQGLDGFPRWAPDGKNSLVLVNGRLHLADEKGRALHSLGEGQSPFWLDEQRFGFVRPVASQQGQAQELVIGATDESELTTAWTTGMLDLDLIDATVDTPFYVQHVMPIGGGRPRLLLYGRQYAGEESRYAIISFDLTDADARDVAAKVVGPARLELSLDRAPAGLPSPADPNGRVPFTVSPDGRWLTAAHLGEKGANEWLIHVAEIGQENELVFAVGYPGYSFNHPFFDWSADGRWLLIVDDDFLRLVAPEVGFQRIIAHEQSACSYPAWVNRYTDKG